MTFTVESCWGGSSYSFRVTGPNAPRVILTREEGDNWSRKYAAKAKDLISQHHGIDRDRIRFRHR